MDVRLIALASTATIAGACVGAAPEGGAGGQLAVEVAPLSLPGLSDVAYTLTVRNLSGEVVWSRALRSTQYGDGDGSLSYVGPCDADASPNTVELVIDALEAGGQPLTEGVDWVNPAPAGDPLTRSAACVADRDVAVTFDLTVARAAEQGFFDISLNLSDVFCSAKLDCKRDVGGSLEDLALLYNPLTGERGRTAVLGFACTAGPDQATELYMSDVTLTCASGASAVVEATGGPGNLDPAFPGPPPNTTDLLFQAAAYRGVEQLGNNRKAYWNVALGLNDDAFGPSLARDCRVTANATVSDSAFVDGQSPAGTRWPYVAWDVAIADASGAFVCDRHALGGGDGVSVLYSPTTGIAFTGVFNAGTQLVTRAQARASCRDYLDAGETTSGLYAIDPDGPGGADPYDVYCDMTTEGGGWTLIQTSSDDGVDTWTWDNYTLMTTDQTPVGDVNAPDHDFKSPAYHQLPFTDVLFIHAPSGVTAEYGGVGSGTMDFGSFVDLYPKPSCGWSGGDGFPLTGGTLTTLGSLCDTDLYISPADHDGGACTTNPSGTYSNHAIGPAWSANHNQGCPFDDPASDGLGPQNQCGACNPGTSARETGGRGFGADAGLNTGAPGAAENYIQVFVR